MFGTRPWLIVACVCSFCGMAVSLGTAVRPEEPSPVLDQGQPLTPGTPPETPPGTPPEFLELDVLPLDIPDPLPEESPTGNLPVMVPPELPGIIGANVPDGGLPQDPETDPAPGVGPAGGNRPPGIRPPSGSDPETGGAGATGAPADSPVRRPDEGGGVTVPPHGGPRQPGAAPGGAFPLPAPVGAGTRASPDGLPRTGEDGRRGR